MMSLFCRSKEKACTKAWLWSNFTGVKLLHKQPYVAEEAQPAVWIWPMAPQDCPNTQGRPSEHGSLLAKWFKKLAQKSRALFVLWPVPLPHAHCANWCWKLIHHIEYLSPFLLEEIVFMAFNDRMSYLGENTLEMTRKLSVYEYV